MPNPPPPLGLDLHALGWAAICALLFSLTRLPARRKQEQIEGLPPSSWLDVLLETVLGGFIGGVLFALALPEFFAVFRGGPGKQAALAVAGAALGPYLGAWIVAAAPREIKRRLGVDVEGKGDNGEKEN